jgi:DNA-binding transcriptional ArsR family regulator
VSGALPNPFEPSITRFASLLADPVRSRMALALLDGRSLPAGELARVANASPQAASRHLALLVDGGVLRLRAQGRHRYYALSDAEIAHAIETMAWVGERPVYAGRWERPGLQRMRYARSCYHHLAGVLGVWLLDRMVEKAIVRRVGEGIEIAPDARGLLDTLRIDADVVRRAPRPAYACLDWSERRDHMAGSLPAALLARFLGARWMRRRGDSRALSLTPLGRSEFTRLFGPPPSETAVAASR